MKTKTIGTKTTCLDTMGGRLTRTPKWNGERARPACCFPRPRGKQRTYAKVPGVLKAAARKAAGREPRPATPGGGIYPQFRSSRFSVAWAVTLLSFLLFFGLPAGVRAQFNFTTNNGALTITGYTGTDGVAVIPAMTNGYPVTGIGDMAFYYCLRLTGVTDP